MLPELVSTIGMTAAGAALSSGIGFMTVPALRRMVMPAPVETYLSDLLQFDWVLEDGYTLHLKDGGLVQTILVEGMEYSSKTSAEQQEAQLSCKHWLDALGDSKVFFKTLAVKTPVNYSLEGEYPHPRLQLLHDRWMQDFEEAYQTRHYIVLTTSAGDQNAYLDLCNAATSTLDRLHLFKARLLKNVAPTGSNASKNISELLSFWSTQINGFESEVGCFQDHLSERLVSSNVSFYQKKGQVHYQDGSHTKVCGVISLMVWGDKSESKILSDILKIPGEITVLQFLKPNSKIKALEYLKHQQRQSQLFGFNQSVAQEYAHTIDLVGSGQEVRFEYQLSIFVSGKDEGEVERLLEKVRRSLTSHGIKSVVGTSSAEWLWRCRLPGFDTYIRPTYPMSSNLANLLTFETESKGEVDSNWGRGPIRYFKTPSGQPYAFQFHVDNQSSEPLAHSITVAPAGSGKTTFFSHLIGGALRHNHLKAFIFDRFNGTKVFTTSVGGQYIDFSNSEISLNPFHCEDTSSNRVFLERFLLQIASLEDDESRQIASRAVDLIMSAPQSDRSLDRLSGSAFDHNSPLQKAMRKWTGSSAQGRLFNGETDSLSLGSTYLTAFEMTELQTDPQRSAAVTTYLMHKIRKLAQEEAIPHLVFIDETEPMLQDPIFAKAVQVMLLEHRKLRGSINLCFQNASAIRKSGIAESILSQCKTLFLFPNPQATAEEYALFNLNPSQWEFIKGIHPALKDLKHTVLVKREQESVILDVNLKGLGPQLQLYNSGTPAVKLMHELQTQWGQEWVEPYLLSA